MRAARAVRVSQTVLTAETVEPVGLAAVGVSLQSLLGQAEAEAEEEAVKPVAQAALRPSLGEGLRLQPKADAVVQVARAAQVAWVPISAILHPAAAAASVGLAARFLLGTCSLAPLVRVVLWEPVARATVITMDPMA